MEFIALKRFINAGFKYDGFLALNGEPIEHWVMS